MSNADDTRDMLAAANPDQAGLVMSRDQVVEHWCAQHGKSKDDLSIEDMMAIRALPEWRNVG